MDPAASVLALRLLENEAAYNLTRAAGGKETENPLAWAP